MLNRTPLLTTKTLRTLTSYLPAGIPLDLSEEDGIYWANNPDKLHQAMAQTLRRTKLTDNWLDVIIERQKQVMGGFLGGLRQEDLDFFAATLDHRQELVEHWLQSQLVPLCLPRKSFSDEFLASKAPMSQFYREQVAAGNIKRMTNGQPAAVESIGLDGIVALVDTRLKPRYNSGKQPFPNDGKFLGPIIKRLRKSGDMESYQYGPATSRFGVSVKEWQGWIKPALDELPEFKGVVTWRLETYPEFWTFGQTLRPGDGNTNTWVWLEEFFKDASMRVYGGHSGYGGLAYVDYNDVGYHCYYRAVRPLGVLATLPLGS